MQITLIGPAQTVALGMLHTVDHPVAGSLEQIALPVTFDVVRPAMRTAPPTLGQHPHDILASLGYGDDEIGNLLGGPADAERGDRADPPYVRITGRASAQP